MKISAGFCNQIDIWENQNSIKATLGGRKIKKTEGREKLVITKIGILLIYTEN